MGAAGAASVEECLLVPDPRGSVWADENGCGIQGSWYMYNDCDLDSGRVDCTQWQIPEPGEFEPGVDGMCTQGLTAVVTDSTQITERWGAGIALDLNYNSTTGKQDPIGFITPPALLRGFRFRYLDRLGTLTEPQSVRVNLPTETTLEEPHFERLPGTGEYLVLFTDEDLRQGSWVEDRRPLDWRRITSIQFQVPNQVGSGIQFDYCISDLSALPDLGGE